MSGNNLAKVTVRTRSSTFNSSTTQQVGEFTTNLLVVTEWRRQLSPGLSHNWHDDPAVFFRTSILAKELRWNGPRIVNKCLGVLSLCDTLTRMTLLQYNYPREQKPNPSSLSAAERPVVERTNRPAFIRSNSATEALLLPDQLTNWKVIRITSRNYERVVRAGTNSRQAATSENIPVHTD